MQKPELSSSARWAWIVAVALAAVLPYALKTAADHDLWWHLKTGQMILEQGGLPATDPFSFTAPGAPWTNHEWLSDVVLAAVYDAGGDEALSLLRTGLLLAAMAGLALLLWNRLPHPLFVLGGSLLAVPLFRVVNLRPHSYTYLFVILLLLALEASVRRPKLLWLLPPLMALWTNLHGGFVLGLGILTLGLAARWFGFEDPARVPSRQERLLLLAVCGTSLIAPLFNPYGFGLFAYLGRELGADHSVILEWQGIWSFPEYRLQFLLLVLFPIVGLALTRRARPLMPIVLLAISTAATLVHGRFLILLVIFSMLVTFSAISALLQRYLPHGSGVVLHRLTTPRWAWALVALPLFAAVLQFTVDIKKKGLRLQIPFHVPVEACEFLQRYELGPNLLLRLDWGGYAIWHLYPRYRVSGDGRNLTVYGEEFVDELLRAYDAGRFAEFSQRYEVDVILSESAGPTYNELRSHEGWVPIHQDRLATVFVRPEIARSVRPRNVLAPVVQPAAERFFFP
jgi:hypothetical protein